jgi:ferric-dicitrate binding protein FerR (iron transport regulator)
MDCEKAAALLSGELDGALAPEERAQFDAHLGQCATCRATREAFRLQDAELRRAFAPRREAAVAVAERVIAQLAATPPKPRTLPRWLPMLLSAAAGFLLAVGIFRPWEKHPVPPPPYVEATTPPETVQLAVATGPVEVLPPRETTWKSFACPSSVEVGCRVRTPAETRCELRTKDGSEVRLNGGTELTFQTGRQLELALGQMLASVAVAATPFEVKVPEATVTATGTQFDLWSKPAETTLTVLQGSTRVSGAGADETVSTGEAARIAKGQVEKYPVQDLIRATRWVHEILVLKGRNNPELAKRVDDLFAQIGASKTSYMSEEEIRALGDHCVLPLTRFIQSDRSRLPGEKHRRVEAARILADLAQPWSIPDLIEMLADDDKDVRYFAAKGLERLTQKSHGREPAAWRDQPRQTLDGSIQEWRSWWQKNKDRYPRAP